MNSHKKKNSRDIFNLVSVFLMLMLFFDNLFGPVFRNYPDGRCNNNCDDDCRRIKISTDKTNDLDQKVNREFSGPINTMKKGLVRLVCPVKGETKQHVHQ